MERNFSKDSDYHTQRNNAIVPYSSCNTTAAVMALKQADWSIPEARGGEAPQEEDRLSAHLQTDEAFRIQRELAPWSVNGYPPQQVHVCLQWGINSWVGSDADRFNHRARAADILSTLESGGGVILSGNFPLPGDELGHIVSVAGYVTKNGSSEVTKWIIDDPYGNWHTGYTDTRGNNVWLSLAQFERIFDRGESRYWAHLIRPATVKYTV